MREELVSGFVWELSGSSDPVPPTGRMIKKKQKNKYMVVVVF